MDPYQLLGISKGSTKAEVKAAFRAKAKLYHPDIYKSPNASELFRQLKLAADAIMGQAPAFKGPPNAERIFRVLTVNKGEASITIMKQFAEMGGWIYCMVDAQEFKLFLEPTKKRYITIASSNLTINIVVE